MPKRNWVKLIPRYLKDKQCTWIDRDCLLTHYMFECLCNYVEGELEGLIYDVEYDKVFVINDFPHKLAESEFVLEAFRLYHWWTFERLERMKESWYEELIVDFDPEFTDKECEEKSMTTWADMDEDEHVYRLMAIRHTLWT